MSNTVRPADVVVPTYPSYKGGSWHLVYEPKLNELISKLNSTLANVAALDGLIGDDTTLTDDIAADLLVVKSALDALDLTAIESDITALETAIGTLADADSPEATRTDIVTILNWIMGAFVRKVPVTADTVHTEMKQLITYADKLQKSDETEVEVDGQINDNTVPPLWYIKNYFNGLLQNIVISKQLLSKGTITVENDDNLGGSSSGYATITVGSNTYPKTKVVQFDSDVVLDKIVGYNCSLTGASSFDLDILTSTDGATWTELGKIDGIATDPALTLGRKIGYTLRANTLYCLSMEAPTQYHKHSLDISTTIFPEQS